MPGNDTRGWPLASTNKCTHTYKHIHSHQIKRLKWSNSMLCRPSKVTTQWKTWLQTKNNETIPENTFPWCSEYNHKTRWNGRLSEDTGDRKLLSHRTSPRTVEKRGCIVLTEMFTFRQSPRKVFVRFIYLWFIGVRLHICMCTVYMQYPQRPDEGTRVTDHCQPPSAC